jgi:transcriptional regulator with XRE-family HTH domain
MSEAFRTWLSEELNRLSWSHRELARRTGLSQSIVSKTLSGERKPSADLCIKAANATGHAPETVLRLAGILPESSDDSTLTEAMDTLKSLPPDRRKQALDYLRYLLGKGGE